ncbi:MAG: ABC transporter permease [Gemmatimonadaceae bacterium]|nr:ABC transporter permease [Gemmatimonadaceae bacterium]
MITAVLAAVSVGVGALRDNPLRTILSTLGVIVGVGALVSVLSLGDAMESFVRGELARTTDVQAVTVQVRSRILVDGEWVPVRDVPIFTPTHLEQLQRELPMVRGAAMFLNGSARVAWLRSGKQRQVGITATTPGIDAFGKTALAVGRPFTVAEATHNAPVILLSYRLAAELAAGRPAESLLDEWVRVRGLPRQVIGIFAAFTGEFGYSARVPYSAAGAVFGPNFSRNAPQLMLQARTVEDLPGMQHGIEDWLASRYRNWDDKVEIKAMEQQLEQVTQGFGVMKLFLGTLAGISLLVGGIGIMNIMLANVTERTREIGIRKALGARAHDINVQFLTEAVTIACFGCALGVALGATITAGAVMGIRAWSKVENLHFVISPSTLLVAVGSSAVIGLVFGTYPARRASRLSPIDAIRHE